MEGIVLLHPIAVNPVC